MEESVEGEEVLRYMSVLLGAKVKYFYQGRGGPKLPYVTLTSMRTMLNVLLCFKKTDFAFGLLKTRDKLLLEMQHNVEHSF
jgi:hypothetical protein